MVDRASTIVKSGDSFTTGTVTSFFHFYSKSLIECLLDRLAGAPGQIGLVALSLSYGSAKMTQGQDSGFKFKFKFGPNRLFKFAARTGKLNALTRPC